MLLFQENIFSAGYIKQFLEVSLDGLKVNTIITDGYRAYPEIIESLGAKQQRCTFHVMKNLMDEINPIHSRLKRKIKNSQQKIEDLEENLIKLQEKYQGKVRNTKRR